MKLEQRCRAPQRGRLSKPEHQRSRASSSCHFERPSEAERTRAANVSASAKPSGAEQRFRAPQRSRARAAISSAPATPTGLDSYFERPSGSEAGSSSDSERPSGSEAGSSGHFERHCGSERARATISSAPAAPSGLERPFRAPSGCGTVNSGVFEAPSGHEALEHARPPRRQTQI